MSTDWRSGLRRSFGYRRLVLEALEDRRLLAVGELLATLDDPSAAPQRDSGFGQCVAVYGDTCVVGAPEADVNGVVDQGRVYVLNTNTGAVVTAIENPNSGSGEGFGTAVAIAENLVVVASPGYNNSHGRVYVFDISSGRGVVACTIDNPAFDGSGGFGRSVAISGPSQFGGFVFVGAPTAQVGSHLAGKVYVFEALAGGAYHTAINNPTPADQDRFGTALAVSGDNLVVTDPNDRDAIGGRVGTAFLMGMNGESRDVFANPEGPGEYGASVAISGSVVVVGAPSGGLTGTGAAYVFSTISEDVWALDNPNFAPTLNDRFGASVAAFWQTIVVGGSEQAVSGLPKAGAAYLYTFDTAWRLAGMLDRPDTEANDCFGQGVAVSPSAVIVGAPGGGTRADDHGSAYLFDTTGQLRSTVVDPTRDNHQQFGWSTAVWDQYALVGARCDSTGGQGAGAAYLFNMATGNVEQAFNNPGPAADDAFGASVTLTGSTVVVGSPNDDVSGTNAGAVYVYDWGADSPRDCLAPAAGGSQFGHSVAIADNLIAVGAPDAGVNQSGIVYLYDASTNPCTLVHTLFNPFPAANDHFGWSVAISGSTLVVGAKDVDVGAVIDAGVAYVYDAGTGSLLRTLNNPTPAASEVFGSSVAISGNTAVIGTPYEGSTRAGAAYVFNTQNGVLTQTLKQATPVTAAHFGASVAAFDNLVLVGAPDDYAGSAYLFDASTGELMSSLANPTPQAYDLFGASVALGANRLLIAAPQDNGSAIQRGSAYVFRGVSTVVATAFDASPDHVPGAQTTVSYTIANSGSAVGAFDVKIVLSDNSVIGDSDDLVVATRGYPGLAAQGSMNDSMLVTIPSTVRQAMYNSWAKRDDPPSLALPHASTSSDYLAIVISEGGATAPRAALSAAGSGKGIDRDDITYFPWDIDSSGRVTPTDAIFVINRLGQIAPACDRRADPDGSGVVTATDAIGVINRLGYSRNTGVDEIPRASGVATETSVPSVEDLSVAAPPPVVAANADDQDAVRLPGIARFAALQSAQRVPVFSAGTAVSSQSTSPFDVAGNVAARRISDQPVADIAASEPRIRPLDRDAVDQSLRSTVQAEDDQVDAIDLPMHEIEPPRT